MNRSKPDRYLLDRQFKRVPLVEQEKPTVLWRPGDRGMERVELFPRESSLAKQHWQERWIRRLLWLIGLTVLVGVGVLLWL